FYPQQQSQDWRSDRVARLRNDAPCRKRRTLVVHDGRQTADDGEQTQPCAGPLAAAPGRQESGTRSRDTALGRQRQPPPRDHWRRWHDLAPELLARALAVVHSPWPALRLACAADAIAQSLVGTTFEPLICC